MANQHNFRLKAGLQALNCGASAFAALAAPPLVSKKISQQYVSQLVAGTREFDSNQEAEEFLKVVDTMAHLQDVIVPKLPIAWSDVLGVKDVLTQEFFTRKNIEDPVVPRCWYIRLNSLAWLKEVRGNEPIGTYNFQVDGAAFESTALAEEAVRRLRAVGIITKMEVLTSDRRRSTISRSLEEIGLTVKEQDNGND